MKGSRLTKINHIAVVVSDVNEALNFWQKALGLPLAHVEHNEDELVEIAFLPLGEGQGEIELIAPFTEDSGIAKYLAKRGAGMHHLCIEVDDIDALMQQLVANGIEMINETPRSRPDGRRYAFVHPRSTGGVLLELYESKPG
jgi:methylmalonyl-CoA/ethylmalonyl-CoA epimerase